LSAPISGPDVSERVSLPEKEKSVTVVLAKLMYVATLLSIMTSVMMGCVRFRLGTKVAQLSVGAFLHYVRLTGMGEHIYKSTEEMALTGTYDYIFHHGVTRRLQLVDMGF
jgi:hypothetical protein